MDEFTIIHETQYSTLPLVLFPAVAFLDFFSQVRDDLRKSKGIIYKKFVESKVNRLEKATFRIREKKKFLKAYQKEERRLLNSVVKYDGKNQKAFGDSMEHVRKQIRSKLAEKYSKELEKMDNILCIFFNLAKEDPQALHGSYALCQFLFSNFSKKRHINEKKMKTVAEFITDFQMILYQTESPGVPAVRNSWDQEIYKRLTLHIQKGM